MTVAEVLRQAKALSADERKELVRSLIDQIADEEKKPKRSLFELRGAAKGVWKDVDVQAYLDELRDEWDRDR